MYDIGIFPVLLPEEKEALAEMEIQFPLVGEDDTQNNPLAFYATSNPPTVIMPIQSLKFLDDLSIAYAWLWVNSYELETVTDYVAMLKYHKEDFLNGKFPPPLVALRIPDNAIENPEVDELALRFFNSARAFILAHELGHIYHRHPGNNRVPFETSQNNEEEADLFALDIMARTSTIPMGSYLFFLVLAHWDNNLSDFQNSAEWQAYLAGSTHPLTARRMNVMGSYLSKSADSFTQNEPDPTVALDVIDFIANGMADIADLLEDPDIQLSMKLKGQATDLVFLAPRYPGILPCEHWQALDSSQEISSAFQGIYMGEYIRNLADSSTEELPMCMILNRKNERVTGFFSFGLGEGTIVGQIVGDNLIFNWQWGQTNGKGKLEATQQDGGFSGVWGYNDSQDNGGEWSGHKQ
jgi:hypothetical protein